MHKGEKEDNGGVRMAIGLARCGKKNGAEWSGTTGSSAIGGPTKVTLGVI